MSDSLEWVGAIGGIVSAAGATIAAIGAWRTEITLRLQGRAERLRNDQARTENALHRGVELVAQPAGRPTGRGGRALVLHVNRRQAAARPRRRRTAAARHRLP